MLYKLIKDGEELGALEPLPFHDVSDLQKREKHLENLMAKHLLEVLFEEARLLPIFQERQRQAEADLYALNETGDLVIFEFKRSAVGEDAALQVMRYAQDAGRWTFTKLERLYESYLNSQGRPPISLSNAHTEAFQLDHPLSPSDFNRKQFLYVIGSAANDELIEAVDYWKKQGLSIEFAPYRIYTIAGQKYFEFFSLPYDRHQNPLDRKGVLFDTNKSYDEDAIWEMIEKSRVSAYGSIKGEVKYLNPKDMIFFCHRGMGIVAVAEVLNGIVKLDGEEQAYRDVKFLIPPPLRSMASLKAMSAAEVSHITGKSFFWAKTLKVPYLTWEESHKLLLALQVVLL